MEDFFRVGVITTTHGIKGQVKVFPTTDDSQRFKKLDLVYIDTGKEKIKMHVESVSFFKNLVIVKFKEIDNINDILIYKGMDILIDREDAVPLEKNEFFISDIIGANVYTEENELFGTLKDVLETGANNVFVVEHEDKEVLLPVIKDCVKSVDTTEKKVIVHIMKGLLD